MNLLVNMRDLVEKSIVKQIYERGIICRVVDNAYLVDQDSGRGGVQTTRSQNYDHMNLRANMQDLVDKSILKLIYERGIICRVVDNAYLVDQFENDFIYDHMNLFAYM